MNRNRSAAASLAIVGLLAFSVPAAAAGVGFKTNPHAPTPPTANVPHVAAPVSITQSSSFAITPLNSVSCNNGVGHTNNSYWRAFVLSTFAPLVGSTTFQITSVDIGIETATSAGGTQPVTLNLYTHSGAAFPGGTNTLVATAPVTLADQSGTLLNIPIPVPPTLTTATDTLVVEFFTPDGQVAGNLIFIGSNASAETAPSYLSAVDCGVPTPTTTTALGFPNMHEVMQVNGQTNVAGGCVLTCPANITVSNDPNQCGAVVTYPAPSTSGTCGTVTCSPASGSFFPRGTTPVTCSEISGPTCSFNITVNDTQPPTITCPANVSQNLPPGQTSGVVTYPPPTSSDNCPGVTATCVPASGSTFPAGTTTVTCTATDTSANTATCSFTVTQIYAAVPVPMLPPVALLGLGLLLAGAGFVVIRRVF